MKTIEPVMLLFARLPGKTPWAGQRGEYLLKKKKKMDSPVLVWGQGSVSQPNSPVREEFPPAQAFPTLPYTILSEKNNSTFGGAK